MGTVQRDREEQEGNPGYCVVVGLSVVFARKENGVTRLNKRH